MHFDGPYDPFVTSRSVLEAANVAEGSEYESYESFRSIVAAVEYDAAMTRALDIISRREVSQRMLERRLGDDGYTSATVLRVSSRIVEYGYLDDHRYAKLVWRSESAAGKGPGRAAQKLRLAGVDPTVADAALEECREEGTIDDPIDSAKSLAIRWGAPFQSRTEKQRAVRKLLSRGFPLDIALRACDGPDLDGGLG